MAKKNGQNTVKLFNIIWTCFIASVRPFCETYNHSIQVEGNIQWRWPNNGKEVKALVQYIQAKHGPNMIKI